MPVNSISARSNSASLSYSTSKSPLNGIYPTISLAELVPSFVGLITPEANVVLWPVEGNGSLFSELNLLGFFFVFVFSSMSFLLEYDNSNVCSFRALKIFAF